MRPAYIGGDDVSVNSNEQPATRRTSSEGAHSGVRDEILRNDNSITIKPDDRTRGRDCSKNSLISFNRLHQNKSSITPVIIPSNAFALTRFAFSTVHYRGKKRITQLNNQNVLHNA